MNLSRMLVIALMIVGALAGAFALVAVLVGWDSPEASVWKSVAGVLAIACAALGVGFVFTGKDADRGH